jgi:hypothetical protein
MPTTPLSLGEERDLSKPDFSFSPGGHKWRQEGYYLICRECELEHAVRIGSDKVMVGVSENSDPIIKSRKEMKMA